MKIHPAVTIDRVAAAALCGGHSDYPGFCIACGAEAFDVEPDARKYPCESCGEKAVYGAEELVIMMVP